MKTIIAFSILAATSFTALLGQGSLDPSGPPAPGMKQLQQINPGVALSAPGTISKPGRYYLAANLEGSIVIESSHVTLDLNGFQLTAKEEGIGIRAEGSVDAPLRAISVTNGHLKGGQNAIRFLNVCSSTISDLSIEGSTLAIEINATGHADGNQVERCAFVNCSGGVLLQTFDGAASCRGNLVRSLVFTQENFTQGATAAAVAVNGSRTDGPSARGTSSGNQIRDCLVRHVASQGIALWGFGAEARCDGNRVERCASSRGELRLQVNDGAEATGNVFSGCAVDSTLRGGGISVASDIASPLVGNRVKGCTVNRPNAWGIFVTNGDGNSVEECLVHEVQYTDPPLWGDVNSTGSNGNRFINNHLTGSHVGIRQSTNEDDYITGNSFMDAATAIDHGNSTYVRGPIVTSNGALPTTGSGAHPWANFDR